MVMVWRIIKKILILQPLYGQFCLVESATGLLCFGN